MPEQGIRPGNIAGNAYVGSSLVYGKILRSYSKLPALYPALVNHIKTLCVYPSVSGKPIPFKKNTRYENSFAQPTVNITGNHIRLSETQIIGNIKVLAAQEIVIAASTLLTDVILMAPKITIEDGVTGNFQAFASKQITVGRNCQLDYPSALVLIPDPVYSDTEHQNAYPQLDIAERSIVKGVVLYQNNTKERSNMPQLRVAHEGTVMGQVYCEGNLELRGMVQGAVYTHGFMAVANGSFYQNHLFNGQISLPQLVPEFVGLEFQNIETPKAIAKWLY